VIFSDLRRYARDLVTHDWTTGSLFLVSTVALVLGLFHLYLSPVWGLCAMAVVLLTSGFRLWRDERELSAREHDQLKAIAGILRAEINTQPAQGYRNFTYAVNSDDRKHSERMFRKHFPNIAEVVDAWIHNPADRAAASLLVHEEILRQMPETVPETMRSSIANAVLSYVEKSLLHSFAPPGRFDVATDVYDNSGVESTCLRCQEGPGTWGVFSAMPNIEGIEQIAIALNELSARAWQSAQATIWKELLRQDARSREQLRDYLTGVINSNHLTRRHCDRQCYELPSGD